MSQARLQKSDGAHEGYTEMNRLDGDTQAVFYECGVGREAFMAQILGLGGVFFKCKDDEAYCAWWEKHMGVKVQDWGSMQWDSDGKAFTIMSTFKSESNYFDPSEHKFMINLRVDDVHGLLEKAKSGGATVIGEVEDTEYGIFGWFIDPEGIKIELWQDA